MNDPLHSILIIAVMASFIDNSSVRFCPWLA